MRQRSCVSVQKGASGVVKEGRLQRLPTRTYGAADAWVQLACYHSWCTGVFGHNRALLCPLCCAPMCVQVLHSSCDLFFFQASAIVPVLIQNCLRLSVFDAIVCCGRNKGLL